MNDIEQVRRELADHDAREQAKRLNARPPWKVALEDLFVANYANDDFWLDGGLASIMHGLVSRDAMQTIRQFYAKKCRVCGRPVHRHWYGCQGCGAKLLYYPTVISSTVTEKEIGQ